jgi:hypothetical protein
MIEKLTEWLEDEVINLVQVGPNKFKAMDAFREVETVVEIEECKQGWAVTMQINGVMRDMGMMGK